VTGLGHILLDDLNSPRSGRDMTENLWQVPLSINAKDSTRSGPRDFIIDTVCGFSAETWKMPRLDAVRSRIVFAINSLNP
jgi:choline dehydrogenase